MSRGSHVFAAGTDSCRATRPWLHRITDEYAWHFRAPSPPTHPAFTLALSLAPNLSSVLQVVLGSDGLFAGMREGSLWIDHTTSSYEQTIELTGEATKRGFRPVECPITGGRNPPAARRQDALPQHHDFAGFFGSKSCACQKHVPMALLRVEVARLCSGVGGPCPQ